MGNRFGFSRVYVEEALKDEPRTREILSRLELPTIPIDRHQELFNRGNQRFQHQKRNPALILAKKEGSFLYTGSERIRSFGDERIRYVDQVRNCVYNCDYCFLQGMHRSAHILFFLNGEDYRRAVRREVEKGAIYLSISYLTDLLAFEGLYPFVQEWLDFARDEPRVEVELRTKSDNVPMLLREEPPQNAVLVFSLSPASVASSVEKGTAAFRSRLLHARQAARRGWRVRLCFDPILAVPRWKAVYRDAIRETFRRLRSEEVEEVSLGVFRIHPDYMKRITREREDAPILYHPFERSEGVLSYEAGLREEMIDYLHRLIAEHLPANRITAVHG